MYHTSDFDFELPSELIASHPLEKRDTSRMLVVCPICDNSKFPSCGGVPAGRGGGKKDICLNLPNNPKLKERAKELRKAGSLPEALLWNEIKNKKINGLDFDRQKIIGNYIVDFFCSQKMFVIEIDDKSHDMKEKYDERRDKYLKSLNLHVMHIPASDVLKSPVVVAQWIRNVISDTPTPAVGHPSAGGELVLQDKYIRDIVSFIKPGDVVVFNNSRVIPARFEANGHEITLHTAVDDKNWWGLCKKFNKINIGDVLTMADGTQIIVTDKDDESGLLLRFNCENVFDLLNKYGKMPLPPYMKREEEIADRERYQTVYADPLGSMAAPTAGLHFTDELLNEIEKAGAKIVKITLHVGAGTWMPVKTENLSEHKMHSEWCCITPEQADIINNAKRVIAVGTTSMRTLESAHQLVLRSQVPLLRRGARRAGWSFDKGKFGVNFCLSFNKNLAGHARDLRKAGSLPEALFWKEIKGKQINGLDFDRQKIIGNYIVDFFCEELGIVIEIDDKSHDMKEKRDAIREKYLKSLGLETIHISAKDVLKDPAGIANWLKTTPAVGHPSAGGELAALQEKMYLPRVMPICQTTDIFITPGYKFGAVDVLLTNFHLPKSTLFMLVSAFAGLDEMKAAYKHAVDEKYRFFSYGDCCLLFRKVQ